MIGRARMDALIPHAGNMCLLDSVTSWDRQSIQCTAVSHRDPANPLVVEGRLGSACGVEYAAQAMAVHGGLLGASDEPPRVGYLVSVRGLVLAAERLDTLEGELTVTAECLAADSGLVTYRFSLRHAEAVVLHGRAAVVFVARRA